MIEFNIGTEKWVDGELVFLSEKYQAEKGMTWTQWLSSKYNTLGLFDKNGWGEIHNAEDTKYLQLIVGENTFNGVVASDVIIEGGTYNLEPFPS